MEYIQKILKKSGTIGILESVLFAILGLILILKPEETVKAISYILGAIFILIGIYKIITCFKEKGKDDIYNYNLIYGVMVVVIGLISIIYSTTISTIFRLIIGIWIVYSAVVRASSALKLKNLNSKIWIYAFILSIVMFACGLYVVLNEGAVIVTIGTLMVVYAVMDIVENIILLKYVNDLK